MARTYRATAVIFAVINMMIIPEVDAGQDQDWNEWQSADGKRSARIVGRLFWDYADYGNETPSLEANDRVTSARLGIAGKLSSTTDYLLQYEFREHFTGRGKTQLRFGFLSFKALDAITLKVGQMNELVGLEGSTSQRSNTFMERGLPFAFVPLYHFGGAAYYHQKPLFLSLGVFGRTYVNATPDEGAGASGRMAYSLSNSESSALHIGGSYFLRRPDSASYRIASRPESAVTDARLVGTRTIDSVERYQGAGLEFAYVQDAFSLQGEYLSAWPTRKGDLPEPFFWGAYLYASYFLTGEARRYDSTHAAFNAVKPKRKRVGAWETAIRYSKIDLNSGGIQGGEQHDTTIGINWYPSSKARLMFNYIWVNSDRGRQQVDPRIAQIRLQLNL
jgi:phosphate-selective porin OprO and OprP